MPENKSEKTQQRLLEEL